MEGTGRSEVVPPKEKGREDMVARPICPAKYEIRGCPTIEPEEKWVKLGELSSLLGKGPSEVLGEIIKGERVGRTQVAVTVEGEDKGFLAFAEFSSRFAAGIKVGGSRFRLSESEIDQCLRGSGDGGDIEIFVSSILAEHLLRSDY